MLTLTERLPATVSANPQHTLALTAEERTRSRQRFTTTDGVEVQLLLARGTVLRDGDRLRAADGAVVQVQAKPEPVLTVRAANRFDLMRAAYHLGNRHVPLELGPDYLRLGHDTVLAELLAQLGVELVIEIAPLSPEPGAYGAHHHGVPYAASHHRP
jgi:urease accessory protein